MFIQCSPFPPRKKISQYVIFLTSVDWHNPLQHDVALRRSVLQIHFRFVTWYAIILLMKDQTDQEKNVGVFPDWQGHRRSRSDLGGVRLSKSSPLVLSRTAVMKHLPPEPRSHSLWISRWLHATLDLYQTATSPVLAPLSGGKNLQNRFRRKGRNMTVIRRWRKVVHQVR